MLGRFLARMSLIVNDLRHSTIPPVIGDGTLEEGVQAQQEEGGRSMQVTSRKG